MPVLKKKEFEELYIKDYQRVRNRVARFIKSSSPLFTPEECEDLIHDIFTTLPGAWKNYDPEQRTKTDFLMAVGTMFLKSERRKRITRKDKQKLLMAHEREPHISIKDLEKQLEEEKQKIEGEQYIRAAPEKEKVIDGRTLIIRREQKRILIESIEELEKQDKKLAEVIELHWLHFTDEEIGRRLNIPGKTIFRWREKAFELCKKLLKKRGIQSLDDIIE